MAPCRDDITMRMRGAGLRFVGLALDLAELAGKIEVPLGVPCVRKPFGDHGSPHLTSTYSRDLEGLLVSRLG